MRLSAGKNIRLFKNPLLEQLTYVHPAMPALLWVPVVAVCFAVGIWRNEATVGASVAYALSGLAFWTLAEYALHRWIFHFKPIGPITKRLAFLFHGIHHDDPEDARRLLMPPIAAIAIASIFYALFLLVFGTVHVNTFFSGFILGYLWYDYTHFAVHFARPKSAWFKALKQNHMLHHYVAPDRRYGVSNTFWDRVFGTSG